MMKNKNLSFIESNRIELFRKITIKPLMSLKLKRGWGNLRINLIKLK